MRVVLLAAHSPKQGLTSFRCGEPLPMPSEMAGQTSPMPRFRPDHNDQPVSAGGEGWLVNADQHKVVQFKPDTSTTTAQWVILRTFHWRPPDYPIPQSRRRMLRHNAIEAWESTMKSGEWKRFQSKYERSVAPASAARQSSPSCAD